MFNHVSAKCQIDLEDVTPDDPGVAESSEASSETCLQSAAQDQAVALAVEPPPIPDDEEDGTHQEDSWDYEWGIPRILRLYIEAAAQLGTMAGETREDVRPAAEASEPTQTVYYELSKEELEAVVDTFLTTDDNGALQEERKQFLSDLLAGCGVNTAAELDSEYMRPIVGSFLMNWAPGRDNFDFEVVFPDGLPETPSTPPQVRESDDRGEDLEAGEARDRALH